MDASNADKLKELTRRKTELENDLRKLRAKYIDDANAIQRLANEIDDHVAAIKRGVK